MSACRSSPGTSTTSRSWTAWSTSTTSDRAHRAGIGELGRAGRDGKPADALLFHGLRDGGSRRFQAGADTTRAAMMTRYVATRSCRWQLLLSYFGQVGDGPCRRCDNCVGNGPDHTTRRGRSTTGSRGPIGGGRRRNGAAAASGLGTRHPHPVDSRVTHALWGTGRVLSYDRDTMTVLFDGAGYRTLSVDLVSDKDLLRPAGGPDGDPDSDRAPA